MTLWSMRSTLVSHTILSSLRPLTQAQLFTPSPTLSHPVLIDYGADESFMDWRLAKRLELKWILLLKPLEAHALDGRLLCRVTHRTSPIQMAFSKDHKESQSFHLSNFLSHPLILGFSWVLGHCTFLFSVQEDRKKLMQCYFLFCNLILFLNQFRDDAIL